MGRTPAAGPDIVPARDLDSVEDVLSLVRARGGRATTARRLLIEVLFERTEHLTAEELAAEVQASAPDVHVSTVYRNLDELERLGVVTHTHLGHGPSTYHLAAHRHGHFVCQDCGTTIEVPVSLFKTLGRNASAQFGFVIDPGHSAIMGRCGRCHSIDSQASAQAASPVWDARTAREPKRGSLPS